MEIEIDKDLFEKVVNSLDKSCDNILELNENSDFLIEEIDENEYNLFSKEFVAKINRIIDLGDESFEMGTWEKKYYMSDITKRYFNDKDRFGIPNIIKYINENTKINSFIS